MVFTEIAHQHRKHQESAWFLKCKVQLAMQASDTGLLKVIFEADETLIGDLKLEPRKITG